ncbi:hypothetical protein PHYPSEUDO_009607 [Phytophthora pseudosyringae]|uniref:Uncharacterized protein n=1 Tax=Phytophthora pseudosyringae TaxID=221518 RepID=A0A8T1WN45_9STRA|nr:hypothetical protein PHYPSEUDO_009607 [Phytophthora pseudosyringae]
MKVFPHAALAAAALSVGAASALDFDSQHLFSTTSCTGTPAGIFMTPADTCADSTSCTLSSDGVTSYGSHCATDPKTYVDSIFGSDAYFMVVAYEEEDDDGNPANCTTVASAIAVQASGACQLVSLGKIQSAMASVNSDGSGALALYTDSSCKAAIQSFSVAGENVNNGVCTDNNKFLSSVTPPTTFAVQGFYQGEACGSTASTFVSSTSGSCSNVPCAGLEAFSTDTQCTTNSTAFIKAAFGTSKYLMIINHDTSSNCDTVKSVKGYLADGTCQVIKDGSTRGATAVIKADGSVTLSLYTDIGCTTGVDTKTINATNINSDTCTEHTKYLSSAIPAKTFVAQDYHKDTECSSTATALVSVPSDSCTESTACSTAGNLTASMGTHCINDPIAYASSVYGNNGYLMFVGYVEGTNCENIDWAFAHLADGACQIISLDQAASAKAYLNSDGSATLIYYNDTECTTGEQKQDIPDIALNNDSCTSTVKYIAQYATENGTMVYTPYSTGTSFAPSRSLLLATIATAITALAFGL